MPQLQRPGFNDPLDEIDPPTAPFGSTLLTPPAPGGSPLPAVRPGVRAGFNDPPVPPDPLHQTIAQAQTTAPDAAARIYNLRMKTGLPADLIARNLEEVERQAAAKDFDPVKFRAETPLLATWLTENPQHAAIAHDDLEQLAIVEHSVKHADAFYMPQAVTALGAAGGAAFRFARNMAAGGYTLLNVGPGVPYEMAFRAAGANGMADRYKEMRHADVDFASAIAGPAPAKTTAGAVEGMVDSGAQSLGQSLPSSLLGVATGTKAATLTIMGASVGLQETGRALDAGKSPMEALTYGFGQGGVEVLTELLPLHWLIKDLKAGSGFVKTMLHQTVSEGLGEEVATFFQDLNEFIVLRPEATLAQFVHERPQAALETLVATATMIGVQGAVVRSIDAATGTTPDERTIGDLHEATEKSKTRERSPAAFNAFVQAATKGGLEHVRIDAQPFADYYQSKGEDPATVAAQLTGDPEAYKLAIATGGDLAIPTSNYLSQIVGSGHESFYAQELRLSPDTLNARETKEQITAQATAPEEDDAARATRQVAEADAHEAVYAGALERLMATGRFTPLEAETQATLYASVFGAAGSRGRTGADPLALFHEWSRGVVSEGGGAVGEASRMRNNALFVGEGGIPASVGGRNETREQRATRSAGHTAALTQAVVADAISQDPTADPEAIAREFESRLSMHTEAQDAAIESGQDPGAFLRAIEAAGGLHPSPRSGMYRGELADLMASADTRVRGRTSGRGALSKRGARGSLTWKGVAGVFNPQSGKELDRVRESLVEAGVLDPEATPQDLIDRLTTILSTGSVAGTAIDTNRFPGTNELGHVGVELGTRWWERGEANPEDYAQRGPDGPTNDKGESAYFIGYQETGYADEPAFPLYNIVGGERDGSTVDTAGLQGVAVPPTPAHTEYQQQDGGAAGPRNLAPPDAVRAYLEKRIAAARSDGREDHEANRQLQLLDNGIAPRYGPRTMAGRAATEFHQVEPVASLTGAELGEGITDLDTLRDAAIAYFKRELQHGLKSVTRPEFTKPIEFTGKGLDHFQSFSANPDKLRLLPAVPAIIRRGLYGGREMLTKPRRDGAVAFHRFTAPVSLDGRLLHPSVLVLEDKFGNKFYDVLLPKEGVHDKDPGGPSRIRTGPESSEDDGVTPTESMASADADVNLTLTPQDEGELRQDPPKGWGSIDTTAPDSPDPLKPNAGTLGSFNPVTRLIRLFKGANRSTFLHESAHLFLELYSDLAAGDNTTPQLQADMGTLLKFFGYQGDLASWRAQTDEQRRTEHEKFARAFEKYLGEGIAPTPALQPIFARFRTWILGVYKTLRNSQLGAELTPEVRQVLDRMVASDDAIRAAQQDAHVTALFTTAEEAEMTEQEFEGYRNQAQAASDEQQARLQARVLKDLTRAEEQWWQDERTAMRLQVAAAVGEEPTYRALAGMRGQLEGLPATPLSRDSLVGQFGRPILAQLPSRVYSADSGLPADTVAQLYGFESGEALLDGIIHAAPIDQVIDARTDEQMERDHGDIFRDPARLQEAARQAVFDVHRDAVVRTELAALNKLRKNARPSVRAATIEQKDKARAGAERIRTEMPDPATLQRLAEQQIASMRLRDVRPDRFWATARRVSMLATQASAKGDFDAAVEAKQQELINLALFREATAARAAVDEARVAFAKMFQSDAALAKRRDMDYVHAARAIAASYFWPEKRLGAALDGLALIKEHNSELYTMIEEQISGAQASGTELQALTYESFVVMRDAVDSLWEQSLRVQQSLIDGQLVDRGELQNQLGQQLESIGAAPEEQYHSRKELALLGLRAAMRRVESWARYVDAGNPTGPFTRFLWNPISDAAATYRIHKAEYLQKYLDLVKTIEHTLTPGTIAAPELGFTFGLEDGNGRAALLHALLHSGNESNFQKLLRGYKWGTGAPDGGVDRSRWDRFLFRAHQDGTITKADWDFVQKVWDLVGSVKPEAQAAHKEMYGRYFSEITAWPVETPFGTYAGGYVPALVDPLRVANANINLEKDALGNNDNASMFPTGGKGFTKARAEQYAKPLALNLRLIPSHLDKVLRFIHIEPRIKDVGRLLWSHNMRDRMNAYDPTVIQDLLIPWLQRSATQRVTQASQGQAGKAVDQIFRTLRARTGLNMMAGHVLNTMQQFTGLLISAVNVRPKYLRNALWRYTTQHTSFMETVATSEWMQTRMTPAAFELQQSLEDILLNPTTYQSAQAWGQKHGYVLQQFTQSIVDHITWAGAYEQASAERDASHEDAVREADAMVRQTQGSFDATDIAKFEATTPAIRSLSMFAGYFNMLANFNGSEFALVVRDLGLKKGAGRALYIYTLGFMLPALLSEVITQAGSGFPDMDDDDSWLDEFMRLFFGSQIRTAAAMIPFGGQAATAAYNYYATASPADDRISSSPAISMIEATVRAPFEVYHAIVDEGSKRKAVRDTLDLLGLATGLPFGAVKRPLGYLADVADNKEELGLDAKTARGLISGRAQDAR